MEKPLSVAIIGCGWAGLRHVQAFTRCGAQVAWVVDVIPERAESIRKMITGEVQASVNYQEALNDPRLEAVDICLPHNLHGEVAVAAAQAGKHILCEKPIASTLEEADQMIEAAENAGVILMIAENERFHPAIRKIQELIQDGAIGKPALLQMTRQCYLKRSFLEDRRWFLDAKAAAGGAMTVGGVHDFEKARMLVGEVESVYSLRAPQRFLEMEGDDTSVALVRFRNGVVGTFVLSFILKSLVTAAGQEVHTLRIDGESGSLSLEDYHTIRLFSERADWQNNQNLIQHEIYVSEQDTFLLEIEHFLECVQSGQQPITNGREERKPLEIVLAAYQSMRTGEVVRIND